MLVGTFVSLKYWVNRSRGITVLRVPSPLLIEHKTPVRGLPWTLREGGAVLEIDHILQEWTTFHLR